MKEMTTLSIIVPIYNVEKYIDECITSIVEQNANNIEVILINDGSTDGSRKICEDYCRKYKFIILHNQENQGLSAARNQGMAHASGKYILFLDSDDYLIKGTLKELLAFLEDVEADVIIGKYDRYNEETLQYRKEKISYSDNYKKCGSLELYMKLLKTNVYWFQAAVAIVKRTFIIDHQLSFMRGIYGEDELWAISLFLCNPKVTLYDKSYFCYRESRKGSITSDRNIKKEFDKIIVIKEFEKIAESLNDKKKLRVVKVRMSILEWSIIQELEYYSNFPEVDKLKELVNERLICLKYGKNIWKYWLCKVMGIDRLCRLNIKVGRWRNLLKKDFI